MIVSDVLWHKNGESRKTVFLSKTHSGWRNCQNFKRATCSRRLFLTKTSNWLQGVQTILLDQNPKKCCGSHALYSACDLHSTLFASHAFELHAIFIARFLHRTHFASHAFCIALLLHRTCFASQAFHIARVSHRMRFASHAFCIARFFAAHAFYIARFSKLLVFSLAFCTQNLFGHPVDV